MLSTAEEFDELLSEKFNHSVKLANPLANDVQFKQCVPKEIKEHKDGGTNISGGTFVDIAVVRLYDFNNQLFKQDYPGSNRSKML